MNSVQNLSNWPVEEKDMSGENGKRIRIALPFGCRNLLNNIKTTFDILCKTQLLMAVWNTWAARSLVIEARSCRKPRL